VLAKNEDEEADDADVDRYFDLQDDLRGEPISRKGISQLLGWHEDIGDDPARKAVLFRHNLWGIRYSSSLQSIERALNDAISEGKTDLANIYRRQKADFERYLAHQQTLDAEMTRWQLLLELDSHFDIGMCWWDAGKVQFMISGDELAHLNFDNTYAEILTS
jgi:hypothetical protein